MNDQYQANKFLSLKDKVILIAEDEEINYRFLEIILLRTGAKILRAKNGHEAVEICRKNKNIDIILMDIKMPILNGYEATAKIKEFRKDLPIIAQTAFASQDDLEMCHQAGFTDYITKPINIHLLIQKITGYL